MLFSFFRDSSCHSEQLPKVSFFGHGLEKSNWASWFRKLSKQSSFLSLSSRVSRHWCATRCSQARPFLFLCADSRRFSNELCLFFFSKLYIFLLPNITLRWHWKALPLSSLTDPASPCQDAPWCFNSEWFLIQTRLLSERGRCAGRRSILPPRSSRVKVTTKPSTGGPSASSSTRCWSGKNTSILFRNLFESTTLQKKALPQVFCRFTAVHCWILSHHLRESYGLCYQASLSLRFFEWRDLALFGLVSQISSELNAPPWREEVFLWCDILWCFR